MYVCDICNRTYHWICLEKLGCYNASHREEVDKNDDWACPACAHLNDEQKDRRQSESCDKELLKVTWKPTWEPEETKDTWPTFQQHILAFEARKDEPDLTVAPADITLSNLERQGFATNETGNTWKYKLDTELRSKVFFDINPTNPQADIVATGSCEFWVTEVDLVKPKPKDTPPPHSHAHTDTPPATATPPPLVLPEIYTSKVACIYDVTGKCKGMLTPERFNILYKAFNKAKLAGIHDNIMPPPKSFASELLGLFARSTMHNNNKPISTKIEFSYMRALSPHIHSALQKWALVTQEKMASPLDHNPNYLHYWSKDPRDRVFGAIPNALSSKFSGFSICHPIYDDLIMHRTLRHAIYSAIVNTEETATFMFLPCWGRQMSTNPYSKLLNAYPHLCCTLGTLPSPNLTYADPSFWVSKESLLPHHTWSMQIIAVWNTAARLCLNNHNPTWISDLARDIPEARWKHRNISNDPVLNARNPSMETGFKKFEKLPFDFRHTNTLTDHNQELYIPTQSIPDLVRKVTNWKDWAYTDGSCQMHQDKQVTGAGTYHPATATPNFVESNGAGITNTIGRAELAAITAAILHGHTYIATDSLSSLHQIRKHLLYPELHRHHVQGDILKILIQTVRNSPNPVHLFKVKSHAGIAGNECADAVAKYQATSDDASLADTVMPSAGTNGNPFHDITWIAFEDSTLPDASTSGLPNPPAPKLKYFSNLHDALKTHLHSKHKLGHANPTTGYYSYYQNLLPTVHKDISNSFWTMPNISFRMKKNIFQYRTGTLFNQKHAVRFNTSTSLQCPLCHHTDSALHILSGCQHQTISGMITERHNIACRIIMKAIETGSLGGCFVQMDIGSKDRLALQDLQIPEGSTNRTIPKWLFPRCFPPKQRLTSSRPDAILVAPIPTKRKDAPAAHPRYALRSRSGCRGVGGLSAPAPANRPTPRVRNPSQLTPSQRHIHLVEVKYCEDTRPGSQLEAANQQHRELCQHLQQAAANVSLHTILLGVGGTIYRPHSMEPLKTLGLDPHKAAKLAIKLHAHSVQYAYKLTSTRRALEKTYAISHHQGQEWGTASHPPDPH